MIGAGPRRDLVLVGGGHAHALALRRLAMQPPPGTRISLISESSHTPYSGMLPGLVAGHYSFDETHIDLSRFCAKLGIRFIEATVDGIDTASRTVELQGRPAISYDMLSINTGSQPDLGSVEGAERFAVPVKPVSGFYRRWLALESRLHDDDGAVNIVCVGGGAGSVELALAMRHRLAGLEVGVQLVCGGGLLENYNRGARNAVRRKLHEQGIGLMEQSTVLRVDEKSLETEAGHRIAYDELVWCTSAVAPDWLRESGLPCDERGFLQLEDTLQVSGHPKIFAAGDTGTQINHPRPKAGVYAVRQAPVLARNLSASLQGKPLQRHRPQRRFLSLLSLGNRSAVADKGLLWASGAWVWRWKDRIDREFLSRFSDLPDTMSTPDSDDEPVMHCGGCGAKLPAAMLRQVLSRLSDRFPAVANAASYADDAAVLDWSGSGALVQSVDTLREFLNDPWLMGRVSLLHALSDIYAMGARPHSALAHICLPFAAAALQERDLEQFMAGALHEMEQADCRLIGGHSLEGPELSAGFTVNGAVDESTVLHKTGVRAGDKLVLTKALGTGVLFAAQQQGAADGRWIAAARQSMLHSNGPAATIARQSAVSACTDITGFGLLGHLQEMLQGQELRVDIAPEQLPLLPGVTELFDAGLESTLHPSNRLAVLAELEGESTPIAAAEKALFDPQTSGGLLLAVADERLQACLQDLRDAGYGAASVIGELSELQAGDKRLRLVQKNP